MIVFGLLFIALLGASLLGCVDTFWDIKATFLAIGFTLVAFLCIGSALSYWFWNAGIERVEPGEVQLVVNAKSDDPDTFNRIRTRTEWSPKNGVGTENKYVFKTGGRETEMSCSDNGEDQLIPVVCVKWIADIRTEEKAEELVDAFSEEGSFSKKKIEDAIISVADESYRKCQDDSPDSVNLFGCAVKRTKSEIEIPRIDIIEIFSDDA